MGFMQLLAPCFGCKQMFTSNPNTVPSIRDKKGEKRPICSTCMERANVQRKAMGLEPHQIRPDAYELAEE